MAVVRISDITHGKLRILAEEEGLPMRSVVEAAIESYRRRVFVQKANEEYAALRSNEDLRRSENREMTFWDQSVGDASESS